MLRPSNSTRPDFFGIRPEIACSVVLLPAPLRPSITVNSPLCASREMPCTTSALPYATCRLSTLSSGRSTLTSCSQVYADHFRIALHFVRGAVLDYRADVQRGHAIGDAKHEIGMVLDQQDSYARLAHDPDYRAKMVNLGSGQAACRFVEQDEARPLRQAAGDLEEALFGVFEKVCAPADRMRQADAMQQFFGAAAQFALVGLHLRQ